MTPMTSKTDNKEAERHITLSKSTFMSVFKRIRHNLSKAYTVAVENEKKKVIVDVQHGLSNRLRALISAKLLAERTGRHLTVVWSPDMHCDAEFRDLFLNDDIDVRNSLDGIYLAKADMYNYMDNEEFAEKNKFIDHDSPMDIYVKSAYILNHKFSDWAAENEILRRLIVHEDVRQKVDEFNVSDCVGIHVRMGGGIGHDSSPWNRPENWSRDGQEKMYYWRERSHYTVFLEEIDRMLKHEPDLKFFLAADSRQTYDIFVEKYGDRIIYVKRAIYDRSVDQQKLALVDMILLSRTKYILGSYWSSFTELAQRLGDKKVRYSGIDFGKI